MRRARLAGVLAGALLLLSAGVFFGSASAGRSSAIGIRNGTTSEFSFSLTRTKVKPGTWTFQYTNTGEDPHDVKIHRKGADEILEIGETLPGDVSTLLPTKLKKDSKYILWCSLEGHREAGMEATLKVKKRK